MLCQKRGKTPTPNLNRNNRDRDTSNNNKLGAGGKRGSILEEIKLITKEELAFSPHEKMQNKNFTNFEDGEYCDKKDQRSSTQTKRQRQRSSKNINIANMGMRGKETQEFCLTPKAKKNKNEKKRKSKVISYKRMASKNNKTQVSRDISIPNHAADEIERYIKRTRYRDRDRERPLEPIVAKL